MFGGVFEMPIEDLNPRTLTRANICIIISSQNFMWPAGRFRSAGSTRWFEITNPETTSEVNGWGG